MQKVAHNARELKLETAPVQASSVLDNTPGLLAVFVYVTREALPESGDCSLVIDSIRTFLEPLGAQVLNVRASSTYAHFEVQSCTGRMLAACSSALSESHPGASIQWVRVEGGAFDPDLELVLLPQVLTLPSRWLASPHNFVCAVQELAHARGWSVEIGLHDRGCSLLLLDLHVGSTPLSSGVSRDDLVLAASRLMPAVQAFGGVS